MSIIQDNPADPKFLGVLVSCEKQTSNLALLFSACQCSELTSFDSGSCDHVSGQCSCKDVFTGILCDACPPMSIGTPPHCNCK